MTMRHREITAEAFYASIGVNRLGGERLPNSLVRHAITIYVDADGWEIGRVERTFTGESPQGRAACYIAAYDEADEPLEGGIWL